MQNQIWKSASNVVDEPAEAAMSEDASGNVAVTGTLTAAGMNATSTLKFQSTDIVIEGPILVGPTLFSAVTSPNLASGQLATYKSGSKIVHAYNDSGTMRYKYLDMSGTGVTWVHTLVAP